MTSINAPARKVDDSRAAVTQTRGGRGQRCAAATLLVCSATLDKGGPPLYPTGAPGAPGGAFIEGRRAHAGERTSTKMSVLHIVEKVSENGDGYLTDELQYTL